MELTYPLISCICITNNRPSLLKRAIYCFELQNYPNKELVISYQKKDIKSRLIIEEAKLNEALKILQIERSVTDSLGDARNQAVYKCTGDYVCMWDDDDWHHTSRLSYQFNSLRSISQYYQASVLSRILLYDATTKKAYCSFSYTWDGTILCRKEILLQNQYASRDRGEDTHVITFLSARKLLYKIEDVPFLYIYVYHGENTWNYAHFENFMDKSQVLDEQTTIGIRRVLNDQT